MNWTEDQDYWCEYQEEDFTPYAGEDPDYDDYEGPDEYYYYEKEEELDRQGYYYYENEPYELP